MKRHPASQHKGFRPRQALRLAATAAFLMAVVWQHVQATRLGYRVEKARQRILALRCDNGTLRMELETTLSPANLTAQARGLGMSPLLPQFQRQIGGSGADDLRPGLLQRLISRTRRALGGLLPT